MRWRREHLAVGLCGKGPAVDSSRTTQSADSVEAALKSYEGEVLHANFNSEKATVI